jgi:hypothetical protein
MSEKRLARLEDELLLIRHSGELPVVAYFEALHHLAEDAEGPRLAMTAEETARLQQAVADRFRRILVRELADVAGGAASSVNCTVARLAELAAYLGLSRDRLPPGWESLCPRL